MAIVVIVRCDVSALEDDLKILRHDRLSGTHCLFHGMHTVENIYLFSLATQLFDKAPHSQLRCIKWCMVCRKATKRVSCSLSSTLPGLFEGKQRRPATGVALIFKMWMLWLTICVKYATWTPLSMRTCDYQCLRINAVLPCFSIGCTRQLLFKSSQRSPKRYVRMMGSYQQLVEQD